jgi:hypothetical protein
MTWLVMALALAGSSQAARADFLSPLQTRFAPLADTDYSLATPLDAMGHATPFDKYVPTPGTALAAVLLDIHWRIDSTISLKFTVPSTLSVLSNGVLTIDGPDGKALPGFTNPSFTNNVIQQQPGPAVMSFPTKTYSGEIKLKITDPNELKLFTSAGPGDLTFDIPIFANASSSFSTSAGNGFGQAKTQMAAIISLQFDIVPEPGSIVLFGIGGGTCLLVSLFRRRITPRVAETI